ncbi:hypothetical protein GIB67_014324 [Kingdonia uniflora]|uniref:Transposase n=1 Tax=Kingdonia uniflora TaxID=39325 RepID=A0A7J7NTU3_9MAGN|nr:hypothetical protein GIB67_014324 [Kingdonia uniflora]
MVKKKENSKKNAKGKMKLIDRDDPITISDNGEDEYPPPEKVESVLRHIPFPSDKDIDIEEINDYEIETSVNIVAESKSECDDIDEDQERWVRYAQGGINCLGAEDGYYSTYSSDDGDYVPTAEDLERGNKFESVDVELDDIYNKEEDAKVKTPLTVGFKKLEVGIQWATVYEAREHIRRFGILNHFTYICIKNDSTKLRLKYSQEKYEWLIFISRNNDEHTMVLRHGLPYLHSLCVEILKSNPGSIARTWRQDDTLQWTDTLVAFKASLNGFVKGCRPILRLNYYFLKGKYGGVCLSVLSLDANNGLFPIGVYIYRNECKDSWFDFLTKIEPYLSSKPRKMYLYL